MNIATFSSPRRTQDSKNNARANTDAEKFQQLISLFDKSAIEEMLLERCTEKPGALTPLAYYMAKNAGSHRKTDIVAILSKYSNGEDLAMINGEGDLPLHVVRLTSLPIHHPYTFQMCRD